MKLVNRSGEEIDKTTRFVVLLAGRDMGFPDCQ